MRPTISEQLRETQRILNDVVAPCLDDYAAQILAKALANLEMLETSWQDVVPFLHWDNAASLALLKKLRQEADADLASMIDEAESAPACATYDVAMLQARNEALQALIHHAIKECGPYGHRHIHAHLMERTGRYPMRPRHDAAPQPRSKPKG